MNTKEFFEAVLPPIGPYRLQYAIPKKDGLRTYSAEGIDDLSNKALELDAKGFTVYFRSCSFDDDTSPASIEFSSQRKAFHVDIDVKDEKGYGTLREALKDFTDIIKTLGLPRPMVIFSGGGVHAYWILGTPVDVPKWQPVAEMLKKKLKDAGLKFDAGLSSNPVCLLRPTGTHHRKGEPIPVKAAPTAFDTIKFSEFRKLLVGDDPLANAPTKSPFGAATDLAVVYENRPSDADTVARECNYIGQFKKTGFGGGGLQAEWYYAMGVIKHCTDGEAKCHEYSQAAKNYDEGATQKKLDDWGERGPTTCQYVKDNFVEDYCGGCPHAGSVVTPKQLGEVAAERQEVIEYITERESGPWWPKRFGWSEAHSEMWAKVWNPKADDGLGSEEKVYFCSTQFYVSNRIKADGEWMLQVHRRKYRNDDGTEVWTDFTVPTAFTARPTDMATEFAKQEIYMTDKQGTTHLSTLLRSYGDALRQAQIETEMYTTMGWHCSNPDIVKGDMSYAANADGFIIGNRLITADGEKPMLLSDAVRDDWHKGFGSSGTLRQWATGIHKFFVETEAIPFQFIMLTDFGSPLVELFGRSEYHGGLVSIVDESGSGKTTACKTGMTIWGNPAKLTLNGNPSAGVTPKAFQKALSSLSNIGILFDEVGKQQPSVLGETAYVTAMGKGRDRLGVNGKPLPTDEEWFSITKMTSNKPVMQIVVDDDNDTEDANDAIQKRVFEINFKRLGYTKEQLANDEERGIQLQKFVDTQYGTAGPHWVRYVIQNKDDIIERLGVNYSKIKKSTHDSSERFIDYMEAMVITTGEFVAKAGLMYPDLAGVQQFIQAVREDMRVVRADSKVPVEDAFSRYVSVNHGGILRTKRFPTGMGRSASLEVPANGGYVNEVVGRIATEDHVAYLAVLPLKEWCKRQGVDFSKMTTALDEQGYFQHDTSKLKTMKKEPIKTATDRVDLTRGTSIPGSRTTCFIMDYGRIGNKTVLRTVIEDEELVQ